MTILVCHFGFKQNLFHIFVTRSLFYMNIQNQRMDKYNLEA
jgi:hypothetical protein